MVSAINIEHVIYTNADCLALSSLGVHYFIHGRNIIQQQPLVSAAIQLCMPMWPEMPVEEARLSWADLQNALHLPEGELPLDGPREAVLQYWCLQRCSAVMLYLEHPDQSILSVLQLATLARIPIIGVSSRYHVDPVISSMLSILVKPETSLLLRVLSAILHTSDVISSTKADQPQPE